MHKQVITTITLISLLVPAVFGQDTLYVHPGADLRIYSEGNITVSGSLINDGTVGGNSNLNGGTLYLIGSSDVLFSGSNLCQFDTIVLDRLANVYLGAPLHVSGEMLFQDGLVISDRSDSNSIFVHFLDQSTYQSASNASFVDGVVRKTGDDAFIFPVGAQNNFQPIAISAPALSTDHYTAFYRSEDASSYGYSITSWDSACGGSNVVEKISSKEHWRLDQTGGSSAVEVTLHYDATSGVVTPSEVMVTRWNGVKWVSLGNGGNTGSVTDGSVVTGTGCGSNGTTSSVSVFGPFTLSATSQTALPVELIEFIANRLGDDHVILDWSTSSQFNHSHFVVERSNNGLSFEPIAVEYGEAFTETLTTYQIIDFYPSPGLNYYRLKQVDLSGEFAYSPIRTVRFETPRDQTAIYPNPTKGMINLQLPGEHETFCVDVFDAQGKLVRKVSTIEGDRHLSIDLADLARGIYSVRVMDKTYKIIKH